MIAFNGFAHCFFNGFDQLRRCAAGKIRLEFGQAGASVAGFGDG